VWLKGFLKSKKTSKFNIIIKKNYANVLVYGSADSVSDNKQLIIDARNDRSVIDIIADRPYV